MSEENYDIKEQENKELQLPTEENPVGSHPEEIRTETSESPASPQPASETDQEENRTVMEEVPEAREDTTPDLPTERHDSAATMEDQQEEEEEEESIAPIKAGEFKSHKEEEDKEEVQQLHTKHPHPEPVIDHRLLAGKLTVYNWLKDIPAAAEVSEIVEVRFKNTRKGFYSNPTHIPLKEGDIVAVEAALGHDIGIVSLTGELVKEQIRLKRIDLERNPLKKVYRKAKPHDIEKWQQAIALEHDTMIRSRKIAANLKLNMKIGDVEYQGDKTKAIFYYIADDRVDFRTLIKVLAETFRIRIEMKQIGTRQEAGRIGGIGPCGRKLCCSTFITNFVSVSTSAARYQDISLNPQKLAGQCGKLKCCLNFEVDAYIDAQRDFPPTNIPLNTGDGMLYHQKTDIFGRTMSFTPDKEGKGIFVQIPVKRVKEIIAMNRKGIIPPKAVEESPDVEEDIRYTDGVGEESLNRFDDKKQQKKRHQRKRTAPSNTPAKENPKDNGGNSKDNSKEKRDNNRNGRPNGSPTAKQADRQGEKTASANRPQNRHAENPRRNQDVQQGQGGQRPPRNGNRGGTPRREQKQTGNRPKPSNEQPQQPQQPQSEQ